MIFTLDDNVSSETSEYDLEINMEFLAFMSQNKAFLHDSVQRKVSTLMTKKSESCKSFGYFFKTAKLEQSIIFQNCRQWIGEDIDCYVEHLLDTFTVEKKRNPNYVFDFRGKTYIQFKLSLRTVRDTVEYFVLPEMVVRYMSKTLGISYSKALERVYKNVSVITIVSIRNIVTKCFCGYTVSSTKCFDQI